jgi:ABC-type dipeptide/oligopeptide/nickel transport system permease subunit
LGVEGLKDKSAKDHAIRFAFGASISLIAALVSLKFQLFGGMFLAFPAILPASLTLIERDAGKQEASLDAEGAIIGATGLLAFALVVSFCIKAMGAIPALIAAATAWVVVSFGIYAAVMAWRGATKKQPQKAAPG